MFFEDLVTIEAAADSLPAWFLLKYPSVQEMQQALSTLPVDALRDFILKASLGKESPVAFQQMPFQDAAHFDELNAA
eukprot:12931197-Prorocentrum_lima.AAC.1